jgi:lactate dehydrogenase-like 2-hydroxyacid dehydrogenase
MTSPAQRSATAPGRPSIALVRSPPNPPQLEGMLEAHFDVHILPHVKNLAAEVKNGAETARALITGTLVGADKRLIDAMPQLELIACIGGHVDHIDVDAARARGIAISNTPNASAPDVADMTIGLMLMVSRGLCVGDRFVRDGKWLTDSSPFTHRVNGKRLGIVGLGGIGGIVAHRAEGFDMEISYHGRAPKADVPYRFFGDLLEMARHVDFLSLHCKAIPETRHLVNRTVLQALGPKGFLINAARGMIVDEAALIQALQDGTIAGAGLDVFANEPHVPAELIAMDNVVLQAHHAAYTFETKEIMADVTLANLRAHFSGAPLVTPVT